LITIRIVEWAGLVIPAIERNTLNLFDIKTVS